MLECARLRVKDIDFASNQIVVRAGKGDRDRVTGQRRRHHLHETVLQRAVRDAVRRTGIAKHATCRTFRPRSPLTSWRMGTISGPSRSCSDTRM